MQTLNPAVLISQTYDSCIREIDIHFEEQIVKFTDEDYIEQINEFQIRKPSETNQTNIDNLKPELDLESIEDVWSYGDTLFAKRYPDKYDVMKNKHGFEKTNDHRLKVIEYLNRSRDDLLSELEKFQGESLQHLDTIRNREKLKRLKRDESLSYEEQREELTAKLFENKFVFVLDFQVNSNGQVRKTVESVFRLYLLVLDFYLNENERLLLK